MLETVLSTLQINAQSFGQLTTSLRDKAVPCNQTFNPCPCSKSTPKRTFNTQTTYLQTLIILLLNLRNKLTVALTLIVLKYFL
jgi:hypothetical protein